MSKYLKILSLFLLSAGLTVSYQNCSNNEVAFSTLDSIQSNGKADFKVTYTKVLDVGNLGHFSASSDDNNLEEVIWEFDDNQAMNGTTGVRQFDHVGQVTFSVKGRFANSEEWIVKNNLTVNVIDPTSNTCLDLNNLRIVSEQIDLSLDMPEWNLGAGVLRVGLNFNDPCMAVALYNVHWTIMTTTDRRTIIHENDGTISDISFVEAGEYEIRAEVKYAHDPATYLVRKIIKVVGRDVQCKPQEGIGADKDLNNLVVGERVQFTASLFTCLGYTGEIQWYINNNPVSTELSFDYTFEQAGNFEIRADAPKVIDGKLSMQQFYLSARVTNGFSVGCDLRCGGIPDGSELVSGLRCVNSQGQPAATINCAGLPTEGINCPTVCDPK